MQESKVRNKSRFGLKINSNKDGGNPTTDPYDYEQKYKEDDYGEEQAPGARVWRTYQDEAARYDNELVETWRDMLDVLLVFAGLFSAIVTTFAAQLSSALQPDNTPLVTASLVQELINLQRAAGAGQNLSTVPPSSLTIDSPSPPSTSDVWVNGLWFTSLAFSLAAALLAVIAKQWIASYVSAVSGTAQEQVRVRQFRLDGLNQWRVPAIIGWLPVLLHIALFLFFVGLVIFLFNLNIIIACIVATVGGISFIAYFGSHIISVKYPGCPYRTTLSIQIDILFRNVIYPGPWLYVPQVLVCSSLQIMNTSRRVTGRLRSYCTHDCTDQRHRWRWPDIARIFRSTTVYPGFVRFMKAMTDRELAEEWLELSPGTPIHCPLPSQSLKDRETSLLKKEKDQLDVDALLWLHESSSNATVQSVVLRSIVGIRRDLNPQALRRIIDYFLPSYMEANVIPDTNDFGSARPQSVRMCWELWRSLRFVALLSRTEIDIVKKFVAEGNNIAWKILIEAIPYAEYTSRTVKPNDNIQRSVAVMMRHVLDSLVDAGYPFEEAEWARFFEAVTAELTSDSGPSALEKPPTDLWQHICRLLEALPHEKTSIEAAMREVGTSRQIKLTTHRRSEYPSIQLSMVVMRYIQAQFSWAPTFLTSISDGRNNRISGKQAPFLALLRKAYDEAMKRCDDKVSAKSIPVILLYLRLLASPPPTGSRLTQVLPYLPDDFEPLKAKDGEETPPLYDHYRRRCREIELCCIDESPTEHHLRVHAHYFALKLTYSLDHPLSDLDDGPILDLSEILDGTPRRETHPQNFELKVCAILSKIHLWNIISSILQDDEEPKDSIEWAVRLLLAENAYALLRAYLLRGLKGDPIQPEEIISFFNDGRLTKHLNSARFHCRWYHLNRMLVLLFQSLSSQNISIHEINRHILVDLSRWYTVGREASREINPAFDDEPAILTAIDLSRGTNDDQQKWHYIVMDIIDVILQDQQNEAPVGNVYDPRHEASPYGVLEDMKKLIRFVWRPKTPKSSHHELCTDIPQPPSAGASNS